MEPRLGLLPVADSQALINLRNRLEDGAAEFHPAFNDICAIIADDPFRCIDGERLRRRGVHIDERYLVEPEPDLCIGSRRELVQVTEVQHQVGWQGRV